MQGGNHGGGHRDFPGAVSAADTSNINANHLPQRLWLNIKTDIVCSFVFKLVMCVCCVGLVGWVVGKSWVVFLTHHESTTHARVPPQRSKQRHCSRERRQQLCRRVMGRVLWRWDREKRVFGEGHWRCVMSNKIKFVALPLFPPSSRGTSELREVDYRVGLVPEATGSCWYSAGSGAYSTKVSCCVLGPKPVKQVSLTGALRCASVF